MFERENAFYAAHQAEFRKKYLRKWLVIAGESLLGAYDTPKEAVQNALERFEPGEFMVHTPFRDGMVIKAGPGIEPQVPNEAEEPEPEFVMAVSEGDPVEFAYA